jgi:hypothetical protein
MASNKKPKKKYVPRIVQKDVISFVLSGFSPVAEKHKLRLAIANHGSMLWLAKGRADRNDWDLICAMLNFTECLLTRYWSSSHIEEIREAQMAHAECGKRFLKTDVFIYTQAELESVNFALEVHDAVIENSTILEVEKAYDIIEKQAMGYKPNYFVQGKNADNSSSERDQETSLVGRN